MSDSPVGPESHARFLRVVLEVGRAVGAGASMAELLRGIVDKAAEVGGASAVAIAFVHDATDALTLRAWRGLDDAMAGAWSGRSGVGLLGRVVATQLSHELGEVEPGEREVFLCEPWALAIPLVAEQRPKGVLVIARATSFSGEERSELEALGAHFAAAIDNAWLYDRYRSLNADLEAKVTARTRDLQAAQTQLLQQEKLASIGQLTAGVAHEINNPLAYVASNLVILQTKLARLARAAAIAGPAPRAHLLAAWRDDPRWGAEIAERLAKAGTAPEPSEEQARGILAEIAASDREEQGEPEETMVAMARFLERTREGVERIKGIVRDLRSFARMDGRGFDEVDLHEGLDQALSLLGHQFHGTDVVLTKSYALDRKVPCHPGRLNQVFLNLLVNAAQALGGHGEIRLSTWRDGAFAWIEVKDSGQGIAPEDLPRVFDPFFTTKPVGEGTGLGLSLSYGIVGEHGGTLSVESTVGVGTTFKVGLPLDRLAPPFPPKEP